MLPFLLTGAPTTILGLLRPWVRAAQGVVRHLGRGSGEQPAIGVALKLGRILKIPSYEVSFISVTETPARRRPRHLMDPNNPRPPQQRGKQMGISQVQKWVLTIVATGVIGLHATAMAAAPLAYNSHTPGAKPGLLIISGIFGMIAVVAARLVHKKSALTPLLILGWIPASVFAVIYYG